MSAKPSKRQAINLLQREIISCARCPRLVAWREQCAREKVKRFQQEDYWGKPVPSFGDPQARLLIVGLAPAAHGGNRTGRMFTGDRSGDWLYRALFRAGFANQAESINKNDKLELTDCYITAMAHCAPPDNKPTTEEINHCRPFLLREFELMPQVKAIIALGQLAFKASISTFKALHPQAKISGAHFAHGAEVSLNDNLRLLASYHPSQQNTFTGRLTETMLDAIFHRARQIIENADAEK
ncbi:MAG: uracil-DNA glycosylase [Acidobacteriota bacterium]